MHDSVALAFPGFSAAFEGRLRHMYLDWNGDVTTAIGVLIDPIERALTLPWKLPDGSPASRDEIAAQWRDLKAQVRLSKIAASYAAAVTTVRLDEEDVDALVMRRMYANDVALRQHFLDFDRLPGDAQLACHSLAWALGSDFVKQYVKFTRAINARDFATARAECTISEKNNAGVIRRNVANRICLRNAEIVQEDINHAGRARGTHLYTYDRLYYPKVLTMSEGVGA